MTRRTHKLAGIAGVLVLLLAACGPGATPTPTTAPQPTATQPPGTTPTGPAPTATRPAPTPTAAPTPATGPQMGGKLRVQTGEPTTLDPHAIATRGAVQVNHVMDTLVWLDYDVKPGPWLAESWETPDATTLVFKFKKGVSFTDGSPFNAQVAKWNFDRILDPEIVSPVARPILEPVLDRVEVVDDSTIRLKLKQPSATILFYLGTAQFSMMTPTALAKWGKDVGAHPVGTGPFIFQEWAPNSHLRVNRNPNFWGSPLPYFDQIEWVVTEDPSVIMASLITGALDLASITLPEHMDRLERTAGIGFLSRPGQVSWGLFFNHLRPPMNDVNFRKALDYALDREGLAAGLLKGRATPASAFIGPAYAEHNANIPVTKRDVAKAKELLAQTAYKGEALDFGCWPGVAAAPSVCEAMQAQFKEAGINTAITMHAGPAYGRALGQLLYDISVLYSGHTPVDTKVNIYLHSTGRLNSKRFGDTPLARKLDQLLDQISVTYDFNTRKRLFDELQQVVYDSRVDLYTVYFPEAHAFRDRVQNFKIRPALQWLVEVWLKK